MPRDDWRPKIDYGWAPGGVRPADDKVACPSCGQARLTDYGPKMHPQFACETCGNMCEADERTTPGLVKRYTPRPADEGEVKP